MQQTADALSDLPDPHRQGAFYEGVPIKRLIAWVIDTGITAVFCALAVVFSGFIGLFFLPALFLVIGLVYRIVTMANGSATLGMRFMAIEFRDMRGQRFDLGQAVMHTLGYTVSFAFAPLQIVSIILMLTSSYKQGLTDHVLGTVALNRRRG